MNKKLVCDRCKETKPDVDRVEDPFLAEVYDRYRAMGLKGYETTMVSLCDDCYAERAAVQ